MRAVGVIPARFQASRFPGKPLAKIAGMSMIERVWRGTRSAKSLSRVVVATDDARIADACRSFGAEVALTRADHPSGRGLSAVGDCLPEVSLMFNVLDTVVLTRDIPDSGLRRGDLGAIVEVHGANAFEVEFVAASGRTQALVTLTGNDIRHVGDEDLVSVRPLERSAG